jgi:caspase domain-containing protein
MSRGMSLHVGLNSVDPTYYGTSLPLSGCHNDARDMANIASRAGYQPTLLLDSEARAARVLATINDAAGRLAPGDAFLLTYAGHGTQVPDQSGDEPDAQDESWVLYDRLLLDDEIYAALARFEAGVRIFLISDSCHSGTIARVAQYGELITHRNMAPLYAAANGKYRTPAERDFGRRVVRQNPDQYAAIARTITGDPRSEIRASVIQLSACQDEQLSADGDANGLFTSHLKAVWDFGSFVENHRLFWQTIGRRMPPTQSPSYLTLGGDVTFFEKQRPFVISCERKSTTTPLAKGANAMDTNDHVQEQGNWMEVRAELERRYPGWHAPTDARATPPSAPTDSFVGDPVEGASRAPTGAPIVRTFFWGFHIEISSQNLRDFLSVATPLNAIAAVIGPVTGPAAPFMLAAAAFVAGALELLRNLDKGAGVYISMSWFVPGVFIPTTVPTRGLSPRAATRGPGEPYEQAGDPWRRHYSGGLFGLRLEEEIYWNLPDGTIRENVIVYMNPPNFGNIYFREWKSQDLTVGHFSLHVGVASFQGGTVELRMMIRDAAGRRSTLAKTVPGPQPVPQSEFIAPAKSNGPTKPTSAVVEH